MGRTLERGTERVWLDRLGSTEPGVRAAVAKGLWKLRNPEVVDRMLAALERETHPEVRIALALNILLSSGETRMGRTRWGRISNLAFPTLREAKLPVEREQKGTRGHVPVDAPLGFTLQPQHAVGPRGSRALLGRVSAAAPRNTEPEQFFLQTATCVEGTAFDAGRCLQKKLLWLGISSAQLS
jgi:hypothetical protein